MPLKNVESHTALFNSIHVGIKPNENWATIGVIDKCYPQAAFCVTRITDMRGVYTNLYITGKAYSKYQEQIGMGSVIAIKRPFLLKPTEVNNNACKSQTIVLNIWLYRQHIQLHCMWNKYSRLG